MQSEQIEIRMQCQRRGPLRPVSQLRSNRGGASARAECAEGSVSDGMERVCAVGSTRTVWRVRIRHVRDDLRQSLTACMRRPYCWAGDCRRQRSVAGSGHGR